MCHGEQSGKYEAKKHLREPNIEAQNIVDMKNRNRQENSTKMLNSLLCRY